MTTTAIRSTSAKIPELRYGETYTIATDKMDCWFPIGSKVRIGPALYTATGRIWTGQERTITHTPEEWAVLLLAVNK